MKTVLHLTYLHFASGAWRRVLLLTGTLAFAYCMFHLSTSRSTSVIAALGFVAVAAMYLGGSLMPIIAVRLTISRLVCVLPCGRAKLLASALLVALLVSIPLPVLVALTMMATFPEYANVSLLDFAQTAFFAQIYAIAFWITSTLYFLQCLLPYARTMKGLVGVMAVLAVLVNVPPKLFAIIPQSINVVPFALALVAWTLCAIYVFYWPQWNDMMRSAASSLVARKLAALTVSRSTTVEIASKRKLAVALGISARWTQMIAFFVVLMLAFGIVGKGDGPGLYYLSLFAVIAAAVGGIVTAKSRALWLRVGWLRADLFGQIERFLWRQMFWVVALLALWFVVTGAIYEFSVVRIFLGATLIALVFSFCLYVGLLSTRGARWSDAGIFIVALAFVMGLAAYASKSTASVAFVLAGEVAMLALAILVRRWALHRWTNIDWILCRRIWTA